MNKQEAQKQIEEQRDMILELHGWAAFGYIKGIINQLDEPPKIELPKVELKKSPKVKVPQFVADWITHSKNIGRSLFGAMSIFEENFEIKKWMQWAENQETFAQAWIFGYEVEEEKKFFVKIKCLREEYKYLNYFKSCREWLFSQKEETEEYRTAHTHKELEDADFGWVFDCPGIEIEEV